MKKKIKVILNKEKYLMFHGPSKDGINDGDILRIRQMSTPDVQNLFSFRIEVLPKDYKYFHSHINSEWKKTTADKNWQEAIDYLDKTYPGWERTDGPESVSLTFFGNDKEREAALKEFNDAFRNIVSKYPSLMIAKNFDFNYVQ